MKVLEQSGYTGKLQGTAVALGFFDGVHLGHQRVVDACVSYAYAHQLSPAVFTFSLPTRHKLKGKRLQGEVQKHEALAALAVQWCFEPPFEDFRLFTPEQFVEELLVKRYSAKAVFCGENFQFGAGRMGNTAALHRLCAQHGIYVEVVPTATYMGAPVSASRIREALGAGSIADVNGMLGRPYEVSLPVRHGQGLGSTLGFPTINQIFPDWMQQPGQGVYITRAMVNGQAWAAATGFGNRPTVDGEGVTCETFIPGFTGNLYDISVGVQFYKRIADTIRFESTAQLAEAVQDWAAEARQFFNEG